MEKGHRPSTVVTYDCGQRRYLQFCKQFRLTPMPANEQTLIWFITYVHYHPMVGGTKVSAESLQVYLNGVRALHIKSGFAVPPIAGDRIKLVLKGISENSPPPQQKWPITYKLLSQMFALLSQTYQDILWKAVFSMAFFGCMRAAEFTIPKEGAFDPALHLCQSDVQFATSEEKVLYMTVTVKRTKVAKHGVQLYIGCSGAHACAVCSMHEYVKLRNMLGIHIANPALFVFHTGVILDKPTLVKHTKFLIKLLGLDPEHFSGHSYRIGSASEAGQMNFKDWEIQLLGNWSSDTYKRYIRNTASHVIKFAKRLAGNF